jgi:phytoene/squalene synthetase
MTPAADPMAHFVDKWHRREPEMALAEVFCPPAQRPVFRGWGALLHELREATFELSDARVTAAKTQWWAEELLLVARGAGRHPVSAALPADLPWAALARAMIEQASFDGRPGDVAQALAQVSPLAEAIAAVEAGVHGVAPPVPAVAVHLLLQRLPHGLVAEDQARLPLNLLARHGLTVAQVAQGQGEPLLRDWAGELLAALPAPGASDSLYRRLRTGFDRARLRRLAAGRGFDPPPAPASLWRAWRLARAG